MTLPPDKELIERGKLTDTFITMRAREKWETLVLNGLIGTDEPWIEAMREALLAEEATVTALEPELVRLREENAWLRGKIADAEAVIDAALNGREAE